MTTFAPSQPNIAYWNNVIRFAFGTFEIYFSQFYKKKKENLFKNLCMVIKQMFLILIKNPMEELLCGFPIKIVALV